MKRAFATMFVTFAFCAMSLPATAQGIGVDATVSARKVGNYLFEIVVKDLSTDAVLTSPKIVTSANQPAVVTTEKNGCTIRTSATTDGVSAEVKVEILQNGDVTSTSRMRLSLSSE